MPFLYLGMLVSRARFGYSNDSHLPVFHTVLIVWVFLPNFSREIEFPLTKIKAFILMFGIKKNTLGVSIDISSFFYKALSYFILSSFNGNI